MIGAGAEAGKFEFESEFEFAAATFDFNNYTMNELAGDDVKGYAANAWLFQNP